MAIAYDASSAGNGTTSFAWSHGPAGTPKGVIVWITHFGSVTTDDVTGVTYGGVAMTKVLGRDGDANLTAAMSLWFLTGGIPSGVQSIAVTGGASSKRAFARTVTAATPYVAVQNTLSVAPTSYTRASTVNSGTLALSGVSCWVDSAFVNSNTAVGRSSPLTSWTSDASFEFDWGSNVSAVYRYNTVSTPDVGTGFSGATDAGTGFYIGAAVALTEAANQITTGTVSESPKATDALGSTANVNCGGCLESSQAADGVAQALGGVLRTGTIAESSQATESITGAKAAIPIAITEKTTSRPTVDVTNVTTASVSVAAGSWILVHVGWSENADRDGDPVTVSFSTGPSRTLTKLTAGHDANVGSQIWGWYNDTGSTVSGTVTVSGFSVTVWMFVAVAELTNASSTVGNVATPVNNGTGTSTPRTISLTTSSDGAGSRIVGACSTNGSVGSAAVGANTTAIGTITNDDDFNGCPHFWGYNNQNTAASTPYSVNFTAGDAGALWVMAAVEFKPPPQPQSYDATISESCQATENGDSVNPNGPKTWNESVTESPQATDSVASTRLAGSPTLLAGFPVTDHHSSQTGTGATSLTLTFTVHEACTLVIGTSWYTMQDAPYPLTVAWQGGKPASATEWTSQSDPNDGTIHWWAEIFTATVTGDIGTVTVTITRSGTDGNEAIATIWAYTDTAGVTGAIDHHASMSDVSSWSDNNFANMVPVQGSITPASANSVIVGVLTGGELCLDGFNITNIVPMTGTTMDAQYYGVYAGGTATFHKTALTTGTSPVTLGAAQTGSHSGTGLTWPDDWANTQLNRAWALELIEILPATYGGARTYNETITESSQAADTFTTIQKFTNGLTESSQSIDQVDSKSVIPLTTSETSQAADSAGSNIVATADGSENSQATDSSSSKPVYTAEGQEASSATDFFAPSTIIPQTTAEISQPADSVESNKVGGASVYDVSIQEAPQASDTCASSVAFAASTPAFGSDDFNRADGDPGSNWADMPTQPRLTIVGGVLKASVSNGGLIWNGFPQAGGRDQTAIAQFGSVTGGAYGYLLVRNQDPSHYVDIGAVPPLGSYYLGYNFSANLYSYPGDSWVKIEVVGSQAKYYTCSDGVSWQLRLTLTNDFIGANHGPAALVAANPLTIDNFSVYLFQDFDWTQATDTTAASASFQSPLSESAQAIDQVDAGFVSGRSTSENSQATDSIVGTGAYSHSDVSSSQAGESCAAAVLIYQSISESSPASDSSSTSAQFGPTQSESSQATDSQSSLEAHTSSVTESAQAADQVGGNKSATGNFVNEPTQSTDSEAASQALAFSLSESGSASDSVGIGVSIRSSLAETSQASDSVASSASFVSSVTEISPASDARSSVVGATGDVLEGVTSYVSDNVAFSTTATLVESTQAADTYSTLAEFPGEELLEPTQALGSAASAQGVATSTNPDFVQALDGLTAGTLISTGLSETCRAADSAGCGVRFPSSQSDTSVLQDSVDSLQGHGTTQADTSLASDTDATQAAFCSSTLAIATALEDEQGLPSDAIYCVEGPQALDSYDAGVVVTASTPFFVSDDFNRANGEPGPNWKTQGGYVEPQLIGNQLVANGSVSMAVWSGAPVPRNHTVIARQVTNGYGAELKAYVKPSHTSNSPTIDSIGAYSYYSSWYLTLPWNQYTSSYLGNSATYPWIKVTQIGNRADIYLSSNAVAWTLVYSIADDRLIFDGQPAFRFQVSGAFDDFSAYGYQDLDSCYARDSYEAGIISGADYSVAESAQPTDSFTTAENFGIPEEVFAGHTEVDDFHRPNGGAGPKWINTGYSANPSSLVVQYNNLSNGGLAANGFWYRSFATDRYEFLWNASGLLGEMLPIFHSSGYTLHEGLSFSGYPLAPSLYWFDGVLHDVTAGLAVGPDYWVKVRVDGGDVTVWSGSSSLRNVPPSTWNLRLTVRGYAGPSSGPAGFIAAGGQYHTIAYFLFRELGPPSTTWATDAVDGSVVTGFDLSEASQASDSSASARAQAESGVESSSATTSFASALIQDASQSDTSTALDSGEFVWWSGTAFAVSEASQAVDAVSARRSGGAPLVETSSAIDLIGLSSAGIRTGTFSEVSGAKDAIQCGLSFNRTAIESSSAKEQLGTSRRSSGQLSETVLALDALRGANRVKETLSEQSTAVFETFGNIPTLKDIYEPARAVDQVACSLRTSARLSETTSAKEGTTLAASLVLVFQVEDEFYNVIVFIIVEPQAGWGDVQEYLQPTDAIFSSTKARRTDLERISAIFQTDGATARPCATTSVAGAGSSVACTNRITASEAEVSSATARFDAGVVNRETIVETTSASDSSTCLAVYLSNARATGTTIQGCTGRVEKVSNIVDYLTTTDRSITTKDVANELSDAAVFASTGTAAIWQYNSVEVDASISEEADSEQFHADNLYSYSAVTFAVLSDSATAKHGRRHGANDDDPPPGPVSGAQAKYVRTPRPTPFPRGSATITDTRPKPPTPVKKKE